MFAVNPVEGKLTSKCDVSADIYVLENGEGDDKEDEDASKL
jgi:hypothetical protein